MTTKEINKIRSTVITEADVKSSYSGRQGCMCGCNGKYTYNVNHVIAAGESRGYKVKFDEVGSVKRAVNKVNKALANFDPNDPFTTLHLNLGKDESTRYIIVDTHNERTVGRTNGVYLTSK